jgi:transcriptional regulator with XRE-family HTH domain
MDSHPEEHRIAALLRELIVRSGTTLGTVEKRLGWEPGRLTALLDGHQRLSFDDVLEILPFLGTTPTEFFARLYGVPEKEPAASAADGSAKQRAMERLFERSLRAVRNAIARRAAWKRERAEDGED